MKGQVRGFRVIELVLLFALSTCIRAALCGLPEAAVSSPQRPNSPQHRGISVRDAGAAGDGKTNDTRVIQATIDAISKEGGGIVSFPPGAYLLGTIELRSRVTLQVDAGATLLGSTTLQDYPEEPPPIPNATIDFEYPRHALIHADAAQDVSIIGDGVIDGQGGCPEFTQWHKFSGPQKAEMLRHRPDILAFIHCKNVRVRNVTLRNSGYWVEDYLDCDGLFISGLTVVSRSNGNNDGIDIDGSRNVRISDCNIDSADDALCLKASCTDCENVTIDNCIVKSNCNGIKLGTASAGAFKNICIGNCVVRDTKLAGVALEVVDGGALDGVVVHGISMSDVATPIFLKLGNRGARRVESSKPSEIGSFRNVSISDIIATTRLPDEHAEFGLMPLAPSISGLPDHPIENVIVSNLRVTYRSGCPREKLVDVSKVPENPRGYPEIGQFGPLPAYGLFCRHVTGLTLRDINVSCEQKDVRPALVCDDVNDLSVDGLRAQSEGEMPVIVLNATDGALIARSSCPVKAKTFLSAQGASRRINLYDVDLGKAAIVPADSANVFTQHSPGN